jgi:hypothetical protein
MSYVYFIATGDSRLVKVGVSDDPKRRLLALTTGSPRERDLRLVAVVPGDERFEKAIHRRFDAQRTVGEWFHLEGELADLVSMLASIGLSVDAPPPAGRARRTEHAKRNVVDDDTARLFRMCVRFQYALIRRALDRVGYRQFAKHVGAHLYQVIQSAHRRDDRKWRIDWLLPLRDLVGQDEFIAIINAGLFALDLEAVQLSTDEEDSRP